MSNSDSDNSPEKKQPLNPKVFAREFIDNTTFHGLPIIFKSKRVQGKVIWTLVFLLAFGALSFQVYKTIEHYLRHDKVVKIEIKFGKLDFPAVTVCNLNPYKLSAVEQQKNLSELIDIYETATYVADNDVVMKADLEEQAIVEANKTAEQQPAEQVPMVLGLLSEHVALTEGLCHCINAKCEFLESFNIDAHGSVVSNSEPCLCYTIQNVDTLEPTCSNLPSIAIKQKCKRPCKAQTFCALAKSDEDLTDTCLFMSGFPGYGIRYDMGDFSKTFAFYLGEGAYATPQYAPTAEPPTKPTPKPIPQFVDNKKVLSNRDVEVLKAQGYSGLKDKTAIQAKANQNLLWQISTLNSSEKDQLSFSLSDQILQCSFAGVDCDMENDFKLHYDLTQGNCFTFNFNASQRKPAESAGAYQGLRMLLFSNNTEYMPTTLAMGIKLVIHDPVEYPFPDAFGLNAPTGFMSSFAKRVLNLPQPFGDCVDNITITDSDTYKYGRRYSLEGCHRTCLQRALIEKCGCGHMQFPVPKGSHVCDPDNVESRRCVGDKSIKLSELNCGCFEKCDNVIYTATVSLANWPAKTSEKSLCPSNLPNCYSLFQTQGAFVEVFYEKINYEMLEEQSSYMFTNLLSDFGGNMGLWLGASIITGLECAVFVVHTISWSCRKMIRGGKYEDDNNDDHGDDDNVIKNCKTTPELETKHNYAPIAKSEYK